MASKQSQVPVISMLSTAGPSHTTSGCLLGWYRPKGKSMCTLPHGIVPFSKQNSPSSQHKRQPHRKRAAGAHLIPLCGQPLRKHIQVSNMKDTLWVWLKSGMKTNLGYIHHHPQSRAGICYFSYRKVCGGFNEQHGEIRARHVHNHTFLRSPRNHR